MNQNGKASRTQRPIFSYDPAKTCGTKELEKRTRVCYHVWPRRSHGHYQGLKGLEKKRKRWEKTQRVSERNRYQKYWIYIAKMAFILHLRVFILHLRVFFDTLFLNWYNHTTFAFFSSGKCLFIVKYLFTIDNEYLKFTLIFVPYWDLSYFFYFFLFDRRP